MASSISEIADAVLANLNATTYSQTVVATRQYLPLITPEEVAGLKVFVVPRVIDLQTQDRVSVAKFITIDVAIQKKVATIAAANVDPLVQLTEEIFDDLVSKRITIHTGYVMTSVKSDPGWVPEHLQDQLIFTGIVRCVFRKR